MNNPRTVPPEDLYARQTYPDICKWHGFDPIPVSLVPKVFPGCRTFKCPKQGSPWQTELSWTFYICVCEKDLKVLNLFNMAES